jgi:hypothetical protein
MRGIESEVFGIETFATPPVTDGGCDENSAAANGVEEGLVLGVGIHVGIWFWGGLLFFVCWRK